MEFHLRDSPDEIFYEGSHPENGRSIRHAKWRIGESARPDGRDRREGPSGVLESASAVLRARARKGSRVPSGASRRTGHGDRRGGASRMCRPDEGKKDAWGRQSPTKEESGSLTGAPMSRRTQPRCRAGERACFPFPFDKLESLHHNNSKWMSPRTIN